MHYWKKVDKYLKSECRKFVQSGDLDSLKNHINEDNLRFVVCDAAYYNHVEIIDYCVKQGVEIDSGVLVAACENDSLEAVKYLMEGGVSVDMGSLGYVARSSNFDILNYFIEQGVDIHMENDQALCEAALFGQLEMVKHLVKKGANVSNLALQGAVKFCHLETVEYLIEQGAEAQTCSNQILWKLASISRYPVPGEKVIETMDCLIKNGARFDGVEHLNLGSIVTDCPDYVESILSIIRERIRLVESKGLVS
jgi:hypothetical protein